MTQKNKLSVIVITKNESAHITRCLNSVLWADEIIVFDSGSTDDTVEICQQLTLHVFETDWPGFGIQKQRALNKATGDWVLSLDADEQISEALKLEIQRTIQISQYQGFEIPRLSSYCGKEIKHGGWWPDYVLRLFKKDQGSFSDSLVHERIIVEGTTGKLDNPILHESYTSLEEVLSKTNHYSSLGADMLFEKGKKSSLWQAIFRGSWTFFRTYVIKASLLDGEKGLMLAISNAEVTYYKYLKLHLLNQQNKTK
ncbi:MAG: glycosyltransferase family 2 protein [Methylococcales bacterium]|nr:glycosyltransferase family 2 protein [Methylococcales bacterium]